MLIIREEQRAAFRAAARRRLCDRICMLLLQMLPDRTAKFEQAELVAFVDTGIDRALAWGFTWDSTIGDYIALSLQRGADFDRVPEVRRVFEDGTIPVKARVRVLVERFTGAEEQV